MQRDPKQKWIEDHEITIRKTFPVLCYTKCIKCKMEYVREFMYEGSQKFINFSITNYVHGCTHCFNSKDEFKKYVVDQEYLHSEDLLSKIWNELINR